MRTARAVVVIPSLFALTYEGFGNLQMALFAAFGGFANLVVASFGGSRRDKAFAHFVLALIGSIGLIIGTAVNGIQWLAVLVTIPVTFGIFFAGRGLAQRGLRRHRRAVPLRPAGGHGRDREHDPGPAGGLVAGLGRVHGGGAGVLAAIAGRPAAGGGGRLGPGAGHHAGRRPRAARRPRPTTRPARPPSTS